MRRGCPGVAPGYDAAGNRKWRENTLTHGTANRFDEYYAYDGLHRLTAFTRGACP